MQFIKSTFFIFIMMGVCFAANAQTTLSTTNKGQGKLIYTEATSAGTNGLIVVLQNTPVFDANVVIDTILAGETISFYAQSLGGLKTANMSVSDNSDLSYKLNLTGGDLVSFNFEIARKRLEGDREVLYYAKEIKKLTP